MEAEVGIFSKRRRRRHNDSVLGKLSIFRWLGPGATSAVLIAVGYMALTGKWDFSIFDRFRGIETVENDIERLEPIVLGASGKSRETIRIATFNIKTFGQSKSSSREIMGHLAQIMNRFDVIAIQEVRANDGQGMPIRRLVNLINDSGQRYSATLSNPIGTGDYKECYAFIWDETRIRFIQDSAYVVHDAEGRIEREPMVASFETRLQPGEPGTPFRFTAINAHTKPDAVHPNSPDGEINVLDDVFIRVGNYESQVAGEDDFILLGDLNVDNNNLGELRQIPNLYSVAGNKVKTNTAGTATYDHILVDHEATKEYTRGFGVFKLQEELNLTDEQAAAISDHLPLWAEFSRFEAPPRPTTANQPANLKTQSFR